MNTQTYHRTATVNGRKVFYREAGDRAAPTILLLHGLPTSSQMFRDLIPALADCFHLIAPDYVGFGHSDAPLRGEFTYTFDNLTAHVSGLVDVLGLKDYVLYMQDYGGPVGFRLFTQRPEKVKGFIIQNANAYMEGVGDAPKGVLLPLWEKRTPETEKTGARLREPGGHQNPLAEVCAVAIRQQSIRTTGCSIESAARPPWRAGLPGWICWKTSGATSPSIPSGRRRSARISRGR